MMKKIKAFKKRWSLTLSLVLFVFFVMLITFLLVGLLMAMLYFTNIVSFETLRNSDGLENWFLELMILLCILLGMALTFFFSKKALQPIRKVIEAVRKVAQGDFNVQVDLKGIGELEELSQSFNKMTYQLSSIETLRSDFVNNFSHEFKTPIVSIRGFAKMLMNNDLNEEEKQEYLAIIISESERLVELSTNVLNLSKYENIKIIPNKVAFQLDEQIRRAVLLLEPKWSRKELSINIEMDEIIFFGNEDFTQQVWINLLDNAIKFSYLGGAINIHLFKIKSAIIFTIQDEGKGIDDETKKHIFDKFYQGDASHSISGNGLGLSIVKKITQLCGGTVEVTSDVQNGCTFIISLPNQETNN